MSSPEPEPALVGRTGVLAGDPVLQRERDAALGALTTVRAPGLAPLVRARAVGDAHALTHDVPAGAVELGALRERVPLRPGHVVAVLGTVLEALDAVHRAHLAHGGVAAERVLVAPDGSVVLAGCGLAWSVPPGCPGGPTPADDVADVAVLARHLLGTGSAAPALVLGLLRAADHDPSLRPDAASLAATVRASVPAEPLLDLLWIASPGARSARGPAGGPVPFEPEIATALSGAPRPAGVPRPVPRTRGRSRAGAALAVVAALALPLVAWIVLREPASASADAAPVPPRPTSTVAAERVDWRAVLQRLDDIRHRALLAGSTGLLADAIDPRAAAWRSDAAIATRVRRAGVHVTGGGLDVRSVELVAESEEQVRLRVRDVRTAYDVTAGATTTRVPARGPRTWEVTLVRRGSGWRVADVSAGDPLAQ